MPQIAYTTQAKKDLKRIANDPERKALFESFVMMLKNGFPIPKIYKPHPLKGKYSNHMECHMKDDFLLIWYDKEKEIIKIVRIGSHSELYGR